MRASNSFQVSPDPINLEDHSVSSLGRPGAARPSAPGTALHSHDSGSKGKSDETFFTSIKRSQDRSLCPHRAPPRLSPFFWLSSSLDSHRSKCLNWGPWRDSASHTKLPVPRQRGVISGHSEELEK